MIEAWQDGLDFSALSESAETLTKCSCKTCKLPASVWVPWGMWRRLQGEGKVNYHRLAPVEVRRARMGIRAWVRNPPRAWVKWLAEKERHEPLPGP